MRSPLRDAGDTGVDRQSVLSIAETPGGCNSRPRASLPIAGAPSTSWLEQVLAAERQFVMQMLTQRHDHLLCDLRATLEAEAGPGGGQGDWETLKSMDDVDGVESAKKQDIGTNTAAPQSRWANPATEKTAEDDHAEEMPLPGHVPVGTASTSSDATADAESRPTLRRNHSLTQMKHELQISDAVHNEGGVLKKLVQDPRFELVVAGIITCNAIIMSYQIQYDGTNVGHDLNYRWYDETASEKWSGGEFVVEMMDYIFAICYIIELVIKVMAMKWQWLREPWNYLDALIVGLWLIEKPFSDTLKLPTDATILRTARLVRVLRLMKVLRTLHGFDSLYLLLTTLKGSFWILGWSGVLLFVTQMLIAMIFWFTLNESYFRNDLYPEEERKEVFEYFGTWTRAMLTMFEMTLANWPPVCRLLVQNFSEWFSLFCILHKLTMGFAVIGVINGVFMQETFKVAATDDKIMVRQRERDVKVHTAKMNRLFKAADESRDGYIDRSEFEKVMQDKEICLWLASMEITVRDPEVLFALLDANGDGLLSCEELVRGALALRGVARSADMLEMRAQIGMIKQHLNMYDFMSHHPLYLPTQAPSNDDHDGATLSFRNPFSINKVEEAFKSLAHRVGSK